MTPMIPMHLVDSSRNLISSAIVEIKPTTPSCVPTQKKVTFKIKTQPPILVVVVEALEEGSRGGKNGNRGRGKHSNDRGDQGAQSFQN